MNGNGLKFTQRITVNVHWDKGVIKGLHASIQASDPPVEIRNVENDGWATITFPANFVGESEITVTGSHGGEQKGTVVIGEGKEV